MGAQLEVWIFHCDWNDRDVRRAFRVRLAAEALAIAAILTRAELGPVRIGVGAGCIRRWPRERVIAHVLRRVGEHFAGEDRGQRRQRIFARARRLEWISARLDRALDVAGL